jgi:hypothetical protein
LGKRENVAMHCMHSVCYKLDKSANPLPLVLYIGTAFLFPDRYSLVRARETREGRALPTVETEVNGDSKSTNERDPSLVSSLDLSGLREILFCLGCSSRPSRRLCFPDRTPFNPLCPTYKMGMQPCWVARLLVCISGESHLVPAYPQLFHFFTGRKKCKSIAKYAAENLPSMTGRFLDTVRHLRIFKYEFFNLKK